MQRNENSTCNPSCWDGTGKTPVRTCENEVLDLDDLQTLPKSWRRIAERPEGDKTRLNPKNNYASTHGEAQVPAAEASGRVRTLFVHHGLLDGDSSFSN